MTPQVTPFDHRPDRALGAALRAALTGADEPAFVTRVLARVGRPLPYWEVLASWSRAGITAAAATGLIATFLVGRAAASSTPDPDFLASAATASARRLVAAPRPPDPSVVLAGIEDR
ncbi:MAG TPA: hypothetical protein VN848_11265 [Gemmatimonadales bacterium]|nr:hypothetical protein [Gemmatimonadales bacterium]